MGSLCASLLNVNISTHSEVSANIYTCCQFLISGLFAVKRLKLNQRREEGGFFPSRGKGAVDRQAGGEACPALAGALRASSLYRL